MKNNYIEIDGTKYEYYRPNTRYAITLVNWVDSPKEIDEEFATFEYVIDGKYFGQFVGKIGWFNNDLSIDGFTPTEPRREPIEVHMNDYYDKLQQEQNYEFIQRLKSGKKLYLRFGKLFVYNGWKQGPEGDVLDTSITSNKYKIPQYTYEFDLTGSSKALSY